VVFVARSDSPATVGVERDPRPFGVLAELVADDAVTDVFVNPDGAVWCDRGGGARAVDGMRIPPDEARELAVRLISLGGRHVDEATPAMDVRLGPGVRVHAVLPPISPGGAAVSIRLQRAVPLDLRDLAERGFFSVISLDEIRGLVAARANLLITGAAGSGKTTLLGALLASAPPTERIVVIEDVGELQLLHPHVVALEARQPNLDGAGALGLDRLVREALRMRPDRLVVGEVREAEALDLLIALNSGLPGMCSLHANSAVEALRKLGTLPLLAGRNIDAAFVVPTVAGSIDIVVHAELERGGRRRVREIVGVTGDIDADGPSVTPLFRFEGGMLRATGEVPPRAAKFERGGVDPAVILRGAA